MRPHIGNPRQLQKPLDGAVLAVFAVENRENHINAFPHYTVALEAQKPLAANRGNRGATVAGVVLPLTGGQKGIILSRVEHPIPFPGNAHGEDIVPIMVDVIEHRLRTAQRHFMLGADAAEQNTNT